MCTGKTLESPLDCKEIKPVNPKGNQSWIFTGRTDAETKAPTFWPPDVKNWLIWKDPDAWKDWRRQEKGTTEDDLVGWHHQLIGDLSLHKLWERVKDPESWPAAVQSVTNCQIQLNNEQNVCPNATRLSTLLAVVTNETKQTVKRVSVPSTPALRVISWR